ANAVREARFEGRAEEVLTVLAGEPRKVTLIGLGKHDALTHRGVRAAVTTAAQSDYKYDTYITVKKDQKRIIQASIITPDGDAKKLSAQAKALAAAVHTVRDLGNMPCNILTPRRLAERAEEVSKEVGIKCTVYGRRDIERMKMGGLIAVNRGSVEEPRFVVIEYAPRRAKTHVALVGKGI